MKGDNKKNLEAISSRIYPSGIIKVHPHNYLELSDEAVLLNLLALDDNYSIELSHQTESRFKVGKSYSFYGVYYRDILIDGAQIIIIDDDEDPCLQELSAYIISDINIDAAPAISKEEIIKSLSMGNQNFNNKDIDIELTISSNLNYNCANNLSWKVTYPYNSKVIWFDAHNGEILKVYERDDSSFNKDAFKQTNNQNLKNSGDVFIYDVKSENCKEIDIENFPTDNPISPITANTDPEEAFTMLTNVNCLKDAFSNLGFDFGTMHIGISCNEPQFYASAEYGSTLEETYLLFNNDYIVTDVIAHEMGHVIVNEFLLSDANENNPNHSRSIHEAIADMLGVYGEFMCHPSPDWEMGGEVDGADTRDLSNPDSDKDCFSEVVNGSSHPRSVPFGYFFYLISEGIPPTEGIGMEAALLLILEALETFPDNGDFPDLIDIIIANLDDNSSCSPENSIGHLVREALFITCFGDPVQLCSFSISAPIQICEEDDELLLNLGEVTSNDILYRWTFPFEWDIEGHPGGSNQHETREHHLKVVDFPKYDYYPQYFEVCVYAPQLGHEECIEIKLEDCNGDDPACHDDGQSSFATNEQGYQYTLEKK